MVKERIFTIAWDFPPSNTGESIVCYKMLKYSSFEYDVCYCHQDSYINDIKYEKNITAYSIKGEYFNWVKGVIKMFLKLNKKNNYKILHSRVVPPAGHFAGFIIKLLKPSIKWVTYFSDPIWNSPYNNIIKQIVGKEKKHPDFFLLVFSSFFSWLAIRFCDKIIFDNEYLAKHILGKSYFKYIDKICIIPYGFDSNCKEDFQDSIEPQKKFVVSHVGQIYGYRNFNIVIDALKEIKYRYPSVYSKILIRQVGYLCFEEKEKILSSGVNEVFDLIENTDYNKSIFYMKISDYLLTIDALFSELKYNIYIPSKIYDYIGVKKPIVAISQNMGPTADIIRQTGNTLIQHNVNEFVEFIKQAVDGNVKKPYYDKYRLYDCKASASILDNMLKTL